MENLSAQDVYIQSGEIVKGGRQDRVLKDDFILPTASGKVDITAFCVEHGRWSQRGQEPVQAFAAAPNAIASPEMKRAVKDAARQTDVWAQVSVAQERLSKNLGAAVKSPASESSYQLTLEAPKVQQTANGFRKDLAGLADQHPDALGYVVAVNGKVTGADVYATHELFRKLWPKMLESAAVEAMASARPGEKIAPPPMDEVRMAATGNGARVSGENAAQSAHQQPEGGISARAGLRDQGRGRARKRRTSDLRGEIEALRELKAGNRCLTLSRPRFAYARTSPRFQTFPRHRRRG